MTIQHKDLWPTWDIPECIDMLEYLFENPDRLLQITFRHTDTGEQMDTLSLPGFSREVSVITASAMILRGFIEPIKHQEQTVFFTVSEAGLEPIYQAYARRDLEERLPELIEESLARAKSRLETHIKKRVA